MTDWHVAWSPGHPVRWEDAGGSDVAFLSIEHALERLAGYYRDPAITRELLESGQPLRTPFAWYQLQKEAAR